MTEQKPRCLTGSYWLFRMPILSLVWLFPPDFLKKLCYRRPRGRQPWILQRRASNILQTISLVKYYTSYYSLWFPWGKAVSVHILWKFLYNLFWSRNVVHGQSTNQWFLDHFTSITIWYTLWIHGWEPYAIGDDFFEPLEIQIRSVSSHKWPNMTPT